MADIDSQHEWYIPPHFQEQFEKDLLQGAINIARGKDDDTGSANGIPTSSIDSHEYEFESLSDVTYDKDIDMVHTYERLLEVGEGSSVRSHELDTTSVNMSSNFDIRSYRDSNAPSDEITLGLDLLVCAFDGYTMNAIEPVTTSPSLRHPDLINWNSPLTSNEVLTF